MIFEYLSAIASAATAVGVIVAVVELHGAKKISQTQFEDSLDQQYRDLARGIPVNALIGKTVPKEKKDETRELIYNYLDLSNEQISLWKNGRIRQETWKEWKAGIQAHLQKPEFKDVWDEVQREAPDTFTYLMELEEGFRDS